MASKINYFGFLLLVLCNVFFFNLVQLGQSLNAVDSPPPPAPTVPASPTPPSSTTPPSPSSNPSEPASPPPPSSTTPPSPSSNPSGPASPTPPSSTTPPSPSSNPSVPSSPPPPSSTIPPRCNCSLKLSTTAACSVLLLGGRALGIPRNICCKGLRRLTQENVYSCLCYILKSNSQKKPALLNLTIPAAMKMVSLACSI